ncbi:MAG TPA: hypothetical protein VF527_11135 [Pyrinomonadaceae bacterium]|jgi:hypothetical protein
MAEDKERVAQDTPRQDEGEMSEAEIDQNLAGSFPASDPPSWTLGTNHREGSRSEQHSAAEDKKTE